MTTYLVAVASPVHCSAMLDTSTQSTLAVPVKAPQPDPLEDSGITPSPDAPGREPDDRRAALNWARASPPAGDDPDPWSTTSSPFPRPTSRSLYHPPPRRGAGATLPDPARDPLRPLSTPPTNNELLRMLGFDPARPAAAPLEADHHAAPAVFAGHGTPTPKALTPSAKRRYRGRRLAFAAGARSRSSPSPAPGTRYAGTPPHLPTKRARPTPPSPARTSSPSDRHWTEPPSPSWGHFLPSPDPAACPTSPSWPPMDPSRVADPALRADLRRLDTDSPTDMSSWPDFPPTSPTWAPTDPPPARPVPFGLPRRQQLDSTRRIPQPRPLPSAAGPIASTSVAAPPRDSTPPLTSSPRDLAPLSCRARSPSPDLRHPPRAHSPTPPSDRCSPLPGATPARQPYLFDYAGGYCLTPADLDALRLSTLEATTSLVSARTARFRRALTALGDECTRLGNMARDSPEHSARTQYIHTEILNLTAAWQLSIAAPERAALDLNAANTPPLIFAAINDATRCLDALPPTPLATANSAPTPLGMPPSHCSPAPVRPAQAPSAQGAGGHRFPATAADWETTRIRTLEALSALVYSTEGTWGAERSRLHQDFLHLRDPPPGPRLPSPERRARIMALSARITQRTSVWKAYRADLRRAILDLDAANTPTLASAAIHAANLILAAPAPLGPACPSLPPMPAEPPLLPLADDAGDILSGRLVFPSPRAPGGASRHSPPAIHPRHLTSHLDHVGPGRYASFPAPAAARTPTLRRRSPVPQRTPDPGYRASYPPIEDLHWACRHRSSASVRSSPASAGPSRTSPDTTESPLPTDAEEHAAALHSRAHSDLRSFGRPF